MTNEDKLSKALQDFRNKYPNVNSGDLQTFIIGWNEAVKSYNHFEVTPDTTNRIGLYGNDYFIKPQREL